jgi:hypothetical protein
MGDYMLNSGNGRKPSGDPLDQELSLFRFIDRVRAQRERQDAEEPVTLTPGQLRTLQALAQIMELSFEQIGMSDFEEKFFRATWAAVDAQGGEVMRDDIRRTFEQMFDYRPTERAYTDAARRAEAKNMVWRPRGPGSRFWDVDPVARAFFEEREST